MRSWSSIATLLLSIIVCLGVGGAASWVTAESVRTWYPTLVKPDWTPPGWLFGPVWTLLYIAMGVALWRVWRASREVGSRDGRLAITLFVVQLALNGVWSFVFFGGRQPGWAAIEIVALWIAIVATLLAFLRIDRLAAGLLAPYLAWVSYAAALNLAIWSMN